MQHMSAVDQTARLTWAESSCLPQALAEHCRVWAVCVGSHPSPGTSSSRRLTLAGSYSRGRSLQRGPRAHLPSHVFCSWGKPQGQPRVSPESGVDADRPPTMAGAPSSLQGEVEDHTIFSTYRTAEHSSYRHWKAFEVFTGK